MDIEHLFLHPSNESFDRNPPKPISLNLHTRSLVAGQKFPWNCRMTMLPFKKKLRGLLAFPFLLFT